MILTDEEIEQCRDQAFKSFNHHKASCRGQMITELDDYEYHLIIAIEAAVLKRLGEQEPVLWRYKHIDDQKWTIAEPRNSYVNTVEDTVNDIRHYISKGYAYSLQPLYEHPAPPEAK